MELERISRRFRAEPNLPELWFRRDPSLDHHFRCICLRSGPSGQLWAKETRGFLEHLRLIFDVPDLDSLLELYNSKFGITPHLGDGLEIGGLDKYLFTLLGQDLVTLVWDPPNRRVALCHWKLGTRLISLLPAGDRDQVLGEQEIEIRYWVVSGQRIQVLLDR